MQVDLLELVELQRASQVSQQLLEVPQQLMEARAEHQVMDLVVVHHLIVTKPVAVAEERLKLDQMD